MNAISFEGPSTNPEILAIADRVAGAARLSIQRAANAIHLNQPTTLPKNGIEKHAFDFLNKRNKINPAGVRKLAGLGRASTRQLNVTSTALLLGSPIKLDFASPQTIVEQVQTARYFDGLRLSPATIGKWDQTAKNFEGAKDLDAYAHNLIKMLAFSRVLDSNLSITVPSKAKAKELHLKLAKLKAVKRFGLEVTDWGNDHIVCGGDGLDSVSQHVKAPQFFIHTFTHDGETRNFTDRTFVKFDLNRPGAWPRAFMVNEFLTEQDADGGFIEFLQTLWDAIVADVVKLATSLALSAIGAAVGATALSAYPVIGTIVGAIIGAVLGYVVGWIIDTLKDDIFESPDNPLGVILASQDSLFPGNSDHSSFYQQDFSLGESRYIMTYYWQLVY